MRNLSAGASAKATHSTAIRAVRIVSRTQDLPTGVITNGTERTWSARNVSDSPQSASSGRWAVRPVVVVLAPAPVDAGGEACGSADRDREGSYGHRRLRQLVVRSGSGRSRLDRRRARIDAGDRGRHDLLVAGHERAPDRAAARRQGPDRGRGRPPGFGRRHDVLHLERRLGHGSSRSDDGRPGGRRCRPRPRRPPVDRQHGHGAASLLRLHGRHRPVSGQTGCPRQRSDHE